MADMIVVDPEHSYSRRRMTLAVLRELDDYEDRLGKLMAEADGLYARVSSVQAQMNELAIEGKATEEAVAALVAQEADIESRNRELLREQLDIRLHMLAVRLGADYGELAELIDVGNGQITALEEELGRPPSSDRGGAPS